MENVTLINQTIAKNLAYYRKAAGMTQAELAEKINYSDKSVSKWESGNGVPDIYILMKLANLFGVTLNDLVGEEQRAPIHKQTGGLRCMIMLLSSGIIWLIATCLFVGLHLLYQGRDWWLIFIYAGAANTVLLLVFSSIWKYRLLSFLSVSTLIWLGLTCTFLTARLISIHLGNDFSGLWLVFLLGIPLQVLEVLWVFFRSLFRKEKAVKKPKIKEEKQEKIEE